MATPYDDKDNIVYIDTNLDTHLALIVSDHDTISDLKKRIVSEHRSCFPKFGPIQIHGIKVKRKGYFYHLSDSIVVRTAFSGFNKNWFLTVDVSALEGSKQNSEKAIILPCNSQLKLLENNRDERKGISVVSPCVSKHNAKENKEIPSRSLISKTADSHHLNHQVPSLHMEVDGFSKGNKDDCNVGDEELSTSVQTEKRKRKSKRKRDDTVVGDNSKEEITFDRPRVSEHIEEVVKNLEVELDVSGEGNNDDCNMGEEKQSTSVQSGKRRKKSKKKKEDTVVDDNSKEEITFDRPRVSEHIEEVVKSLAVGSSLHVECEVDGSGEGNRDDCNVSEEERSTSVQSRQIRKKSKKKNEDTVGGDNSKEEIISDRPLVSEHIEKEAAKNLDLVPSLHIECEVDGSGEGNKDDFNVVEEVPSISVLSTKKRKKSKKKKEDTVEGDNSKEEIPSDLPCASEHIEKEAGKNLEVVPSLHIECEVDGSGKGNKDDFNVGEEVPSISVLSTKKRKKSKKKKEDTVAGDNSKEEIPSDLPCASEHIEKEAVKNLEVVPSLHIECEVDGSGEGNKDDLNVCEVPSKSVPSAKKKHKSKKKKEDTVGGDNSKDNIASVDNPLDSPTETASSFKKFKVPQSENKRDEKEEIPFDRQHVSQNTEKEAVKNLAMVPNSHIQCEVDGYNKGIKDDCIVGEEGNSKPTLSAKKKHKNKKKKEDTMPNDTLKENDASVAVPVQQDIVVLANSSENADKKVIKETEVLKEHCDTECDDNNTKNDVGALSLKEASELITPVKKKDKKRKRSLTHDSKEPLNVETTSRKDQAQMSDGAHREREESKDQFELNNDKSVQDVEYKNNEAEDILDTKSSSKKRQKGKGRSKEKSLSDKKMVNDSDVDSRHETPVVTSSREDEEANHFSTRREGVQEEISVDRLLSKDIITSKRKDACKENIQSTTKETGNYKNQSDIEMEVQPSDENKPKDLMEDNENVVLGNDDVNGMKEPVKPEKVKKGIKKVKNKGGGQALREDNGLVDASETESVIAKSLKATVCDPMPGNNESQENPPNQTEGKILQLEEMQGAALPVTDKEDDFSMDNAGSLERTKTKSNAENVSKGLKKKPNSKQTSSSKGTSDMLTNDHVFDSKKEHDAHRIDKAPNADKTRQAAKLSDQSGSAISSINENRKSHGNVSGKSMDLGKQREHVPISNSKLEGSNQMVQNNARRAASVNVMGVSKTQQKKSLLEGGLFNDDSSSASENEDEDQVDNSDASTRTPSDNSLASDFPDGYDSPDVDSQQNGSFDGKRLENGERSSLKANLPGTERIPIDFFLRSSSRYKKAKITASQLDESESQPDFVPDSLAD